ncbi:MAG: hypothetical protein ACAH09_02965 [Methylophilaceae bacterium]|jgi:hypothetical protein|nr:hypothetical protein [Methylophilaceae bacterium]
MPHSADNDGVRLAIAAECCYLANLTVMPLLGFFVLLAVYFARFDTASVLARCHLRQALVGSLWAGVLLILLNALILLMGGYRSHFTVVTLILYFFSVHSALIILGMAGLAKAFAGQTFIYPLIGARCDD